MLLCPTRTVAIELFGFSVHWYGIMYLTAFLLAFFLLPHLQKYRRLALSQDDWSKILSWGIIGVLVGGRLGYVLFYAPHLFATPLEIFAVWKGGMSSHGGFIGVALAMFFVLRHEKIPFLQFADTLVVPIAIGLALGRVGNFINQELYGTVTSLPWAIVIPDIEGLRHPTQIYAVLKNLLIASTCLWYLTKIKPVIPGRAFALFLMMYGSLRFLVEFLRVQEHEGFIMLTRGQFLTIPLILIGVWLWMWLSRSKA